MEVETIQKNAVSPKNQKSRVNQKIMYVLGLCVSLFLATSCGGGGTKYSSDAEGFAKIQKDLMSKFGEKAYYSMLSIMNNPGNRPGSGTIILVNVTKNPESFQMEEWSYDSHNRWRQISDITIEADEDIVITDYLYQLGGQFDLRKVGEFVTESAKKLADEKNLKNAVMKTVLINTGDMPISETRVHIFMEPENGGTQFKFRYDLDGNLEDFSY